MQALKGWVKPLADKGWSQRFNITGTDIIFPVTKPGTKAAPPRAPSRQAEVPTSEQPPKKSQCKQGTNFGNTSDVQTNKYARR